MIIIMMEEIFLLIWSFPLVIYWEKNYVLRVEKNKWQLMAYTFHFYDSF